jgi:hypothetical protein
MPLKFSYIWSGSDEIPLFNWLYAGNTGNVGSSTGVSVGNKDSLVHVYSMFGNRPADPEIWKTGKRVFYSGEAIMDETHADVVVRFMPVDDNTNVRRVLDMSTSGGISNQLIATNNRNGVKYIQLRLQELDAIEWKIRMLIELGVLAQESVDEIQKYLLCPENITPYADMMLSWEKNRPVAKDCMNSVGMESGRKFCLFMVSNPACKLRNDTHMLLTRVGNVVSAGGYRNNLAPTDARPPDRMNHDEYIMYLRQFRFMLTFENQSLPGYHTEKITNAFEAGVIPIYWGDPMITELYDARSFIHIPTQSNPNQQWEAVKQAVARVQEAERDPQIYASYFQYPPLSAELCSREDARVAASLQEIRHELCHK